MIDTLCKVVLDRMNIDRFVETGLYQGSTLALVSRWFSELHPEEFGMIVASVKPEDRNGARELQLNRDFARESLALRHNDQLYGVT